MRIIGRKNLYCMKRLLFIWGLVQLLQFNSVGQSGKYEVGLKGGTSLALNWGSSYINSNQKPTLGYAAGVGFRYHLPKRFSIGAEITFERKGYSVHVASSEIDGNTFGEIEVRYRMHYLVVPILARFSIGKKVRAFLNVGPCFGFLTHATADWKAPSQFVYFPNTTNETNDFKRLDIGVTTGLGLIVPLKARVLLSLEVRNNLGLLDVGGIEAPKTNSTLLELGISYLFCKRKEE